MEPNVTTRWTQLKSVALRFQPAWKVASWCIRTGLVVAVGILYLTRQAIYGTLNFLMPSDRFDRTVTSVSGGVSGFVDEALDSTEDCGLDDDQSLRSGRYEYTWMGGTKYEYIWVDD